MTPELITAFLTPFSVAFLAYLTYLGNRRMKVVESKVEDVDTKVDVVHAIAAQVDAAVNGKAPGEPSISAQVDQSSKDIVAIKDKQETDSPSELVATTSNGNASIRLQLALVLAHLEKLLAKTA